MGGRRQARLAGRVAVNGAGEALGAPWIHKAGLILASAHVGFAGLAKEAGLSLTPAGASFPHGDDPQDTNIRLAPTMPPVAEVTEAMEIVATCVLLAAVEKALGDAGQIGGTA